MSADKVAPEKSDDNRGYRTALVADVERAYIRYLKLSLYGGIPLLLVFAGVIWFSHSQTTEERDRNFRQYEQQSEQQREQMNKEWQQGEQRREQEKKESEERSKKTEAERLKVQKEMQEAQERFKKQFEESGKRIEELNRPLQPPRP